MVLSLATCGGGSETLHVEDSRLLRLSGDARQSILDAERPVRVSEINLEGATVAHREAKDFQSIVENERNAARQQLEATQKSMKLAEGAGDTSMATNAREGEKTAQRRVRAADAKLEYAKELLAYRGDIVKLRQAEVDAARAELEVRKVTQLASAGQAEGLDQGKFDRAAVKARRRADDARQKVASRRGSLEGRRSTWESARVGGDPGIGDAPPPPSALEEAR